VVLIRDIESDILWQATRRGVDRMALARPLRKPLAWLHGEVKSPPFTLAGRVEVGELLARLQVGESIGLPHSRPLPALGPRVHELRVRDAGHNWRIVCRIDPDAIVIVAVFAKTSTAGQKREFENAVRRLKRYDAARED
jgi:phage-related protein